MFENGEFGPSNKPDSTDSYFFPFLTNSPSPTIGFTQGLKNTPDPAAVFFIPFPFFFK